MAYLSWVNSAVTSTVSNASGSEILSASNMALGDASVWRNDSASGSALFELPATSAIQCFAVIGHNFEPNGASLSITGVYDSGANPAVRSMPIYNFATGQRRISYLVDANSPDDYDDITLSLGGSVSSTPGYYDVGQLWAGEVLEADIKTSINYSDTGKMNQSRKGYGHRGVGCPYRVLDVKISLDTFENTIAGQFLDAIEQSYSGDQMLIMPSGDQAGLIRDNYNFQTRSIFGAVLGKAKISHVGGNRFDVTMKISE